MAIRHWLALLALLGVITERSYGARLDAEGQRYGEAEAALRKGASVEAAFLFVDLLECFPKGKYGSHASRRVLAIATHWLQEAFAKIGPASDDAPGSPLFLNFLNFDLLRAHWMDRCGVAVLEKLASLDPPDGIKEESLYLAGASHFYWGRYDKAEEDLCRFLQFHPTTENTARAVKLAMLSKTMQFGNAKITRKRLVKTWNFILWCEKNYPTVAAKDSDFFIRRRAHLRWRLADHDFEAAESLARSGHPLIAGFGFAYTHWMYRGTPHADKALDRLRKLFPCIAWIIP